MLANWTKKRPPAMGREALECYEKLVRVVLEQTAHLSGIRVDIDTAISRI
jgi:hypothetical protein